MFCGLNKNMQTPEKFDFPFPPYNIQQKFMENLYSTLENKKLGIFESPTGTGKSLSIICGALRWLKDHNDFNRKQLSDKISRLEYEKQQLTEADTDWLSSQAKEIQLTRLLNSLKLEQGKINEYDEKMSKLKANTKTKYKSKQIFIKEKPLENIGVIDEKNVDDEDILLEELDKDEDEDNSAEEECENKYQPVKIYICSRTHSQLSQFIGEINKSPFNCNTRVTSLASRQSYCINTDVSKLKSVTLINEKCLDMQKKSKGQVKTDENGKVTKKQRSVNCRCPFYKQENIQKLSDWALVEIQDVEDLVNSGKELNACPYYASRRAAENAEIVLIPYNTLLHKATREANGISLKNNVIIIDEAHNLLEALAQMYSNELKYNQLYHSLHQLKCYRTKYSSRFSALNLLSINQLIFVTTKLMQLLESTDTSKIFTIENFVLTAQIDNYNMFKIIKFCKDSRIAQKIRSFALRYPVEEIAEEKIEKKGIKEFLKKIEVMKDNSENKEPEKKVIVPAVSNPLLAVISFLEALTHSYENGRILLTKNADTLQSKLQFLVLNPSSHFNDIVEEARSVIVAGGTMKPIEEFKNRLFIKAGADPQRIMEFSCDHIIPPENIMPIIITKGPQDENLIFNFENRMSMGDHLKNIIQQACKVVKGGIVVFFPSYKYENFIWEQLKWLNFGRALFREPQNSGSVEDVLEKYAKAIKRPASDGALLFSVVGGKLSEGLNFNDDLGRCVIVVGLPYANIKSPELKEKMNYLVATEGVKSSQTFYDNMCMKAVNQCIGRAVRHRNDYATVLLIDERYNRATVKNALPNWIKRSLKVCNFQETFSLMETFFAGFNTV